MKTTPSATPSPAPRPCRPWRSVALWGFAAVVILISLPLLAVRTFREKNPAEMRRIKQFNRRWLNPWMLGHAGGPHWYAGRLEHRGRRTGRPYTTPLLACPVPGGFFLPLPYGRDVDWARNLLAAGEATLQDHGMRYHIGNPRIVPAADALPDLPPRMRRQAALYRIEDFVRVDTLPDSDTEASPPT